MAIRKVARLGHPVLREKARDLTAQEILSPEIRRLVDDMTDTMREYGGIGLAAPQVHESLQLALIEFSDESDRYPSQGSQPLSVFINPKVIVLDQGDPGSSSRGKAQGFWEGCLSVPDLRGLVYRPRKIQVDYLDLEAKPRTLVAENFLATVFQHEFDHLQGVLFIDRITDLTKLAFLEEYRRYWLPSQDSDEKKRAD
jgi:peptide deformylase